MQFLAPIVFGILFIILPGSMVFVLAYAGIKWLWGICPRCKGTKLEKNSNLYCSRCLGTGKRSKRKK